MGAGGQEEKNWTKQLKGGTCYLGSTHSCNPGLKRSITNKNNVREYIKGKGLREWVWKQRDTPSAPFNWLFLRWGGFQEEKVGYKIGIAGVFIRRKGYKLDVRADGDRNIESGPKEYE